MRYRIEFELKAPGCIVIEADNEEEAFRKFDDMDCSMLFNTACNGLQESLVVGYNCLDDADDVDDTGGA